MYIWLSFAKLTQLIPWAADDGGLVAEEFEEY
jgi:hypothetical protein